MIHVVLVDDEPLARNLLKEYLADFGQFRVLGECCDGFEAVKMIQQLNPDLIFLDIQMPKINGFEMLELLEHKPAVIFTTAFDEYAIRAFEVNALDYLLKPVNPKRLDEALERLKEEPVVQAENQRKLNFDDRLFLLVNSSYRFIKIANLMYINSAELTVRIGGPVADKESQRYVARSGFEFASTIWESSVRNLLEQKADELL